MRRNEPPTGPDAAPTPSKTRRKKDMIALQDLGESLVALEPARLAELALPERLVDAIAAARTITKHEARRRQMQYLGRLMRDVDPEPIRAALERFATMPRAERALFAAAERWRDRLLAEDAAATEFLAEHPAVDRDELVALVRDARAERASGRPPHRFRALFRLVAKSVTAGTP
jgi:ribosome-associated protein